MKKSTIIIFLFFCYFLYAQELNLKKVSLPEKTQQIACLDSHYMWVGSGFSTLIEKMVVTARVPGASPLLEAERQYLAYDTVLNQWKNRTKEQYTYFGTSSDAEIQSTLQQPWNSSTNSWDDTLYYVKYTGKSSHQNPSYFKIFQKEINGDYDFDNNQYTWKNKTVLILLNDSCPSQEFSYNFNTTNQTYEPGLRRTYTYDASNNLVCTIDEYFDLNLQQYVYDSRDSFTFSGNLLLRRLSQFWDINTWENSYRETNTYDGQNRLIKNLQEFWNGTSWDSAWKNVYRYSPLADTSIAYYWYNGSWQNNNMIITTYNSQHKTTSYAFLSWDGITWYEQYKVLYSYDAVDNLIEAVFQSWDGVQLINTNKITYFYSSGSVLDSVIFYFWDAMSNAWVPGQKNIYTYGALNETLEEKYYNYISGNWIEDCKYQYFYHPVDISLIPVISGEDAFTLYPNPASDVINVQWNSFSVSRMTIRDYNGKILLENSNPSRIINIQKLSPGIYYISLYADDGKIYSKPFVKK